MPQDERAEAPAAASAAAGSELSPDSVEAQPADSAAADGAAAGGPDEAAEMAAHFQRVQELFGAGSEQQARWFVKYHTKLFM